MPDQRHHNASAETTEQIRLHVHQIRIGRAGFRVLVLVNRELRHQKLVSPSEHTPCSATIPLYFSTASAFSRTHCSRFAAATFCSNASSSTADRLTPASRATLRRSLLILRLAACLGALRL